MAFKLSFESCGTHMVSWIMWHTHGFLNHVALTWSLESCGTNTVSWIIWHLHGHLNQVTLHGLLNHVTLHGLLNHVILHGLLNHVILHGLLLAANIRINFKITTLEFSSISELLLEFQFGNNPGSLVSLNNIEIQIWIQNKSTNEWKKTNKIKLKLK